MKKRLFSFVLTVTALFAASFTVADDGVAVISYQANPKAMTSSDFVTRLLALPEWEPFIENFGNACDKAIGKELSREKLTEHLPDNAVNEIRTFLESGISTRKAIEGTFQHLETVFFELRANIDENNLQNIVDLLQGRKKNLDIDFNGLLAFVIDVNPRCGLSILQYFREGKDYEFLRNEPNGDFVLKFSFKVHDRNIDFGCAGVKIDEKRYAVLFSGDDTIIQYSESFKAEKYPKLETLQPKAQLVFEEPCFLFLDRQLKQANLESNGMDFFTKIRQAKAAFRDVNGISQLEITGVMRTAEDAKAFQDMLTGLIAFVQFSRDENSPERGLLQAIQIKAAETEVSAALKLDNTDLWKMIGKGLNKATDEIKNRQ